MAADLAPLDGSTYFLSVATGDIDVKGAEGFFHADMRHLATWRLLVDEEPIHVLASTCVDAYSARVVGTLASAGPGTNPPVSIRRDRFVAGGVHEDLVVENNAEEERRITLDLYFGSDFADILDCKTNPSKEGAVRVEVDSEARSVRLVYERDDYMRGTTISFSEPGLLSDRRATFELVLGARERWHTCIDVTPLVDGEERKPRLRCESFGRDEPQVPLSLEEWLEAAPSLTTSYDGLAHVYRQSLVDLASLRFLPLPDLDFAITAGGLPWFMALFGRDSLITAYQLLPFQPLTARATLQALAQLQATEDDPFRDAEPGKILHELRFGELATLEDEPHSPYYGSHESTLLFLILLDEYERWTGDVELVLSLEGAARAALAWVEEWGDLDGDGYLEYRKRSPHGLDNQGWKDSDNSVVFADGRLAEPPIATCELQGLAYDARLRVARLAREQWGDAELAERLEREATALKGRFDRDFWIEGRGHYALALDGDKRPVDSLTSNTGWLLWTGIVPEGRAAAVVASLLDASMFTGYGVRTLSSEESAYNPIEYHNGSVWPFDTAIAAEGMRRYGFREEASRLTVALIETAEKFSYRLPEVFAGTARDEADVPVGYPSASTPQAWSSGAPLHGLRTLLGLDVEAGRLRSDPHLPPPIESLELTGIPVRGGREDVSAGR